MARFFGDDFAQNDVAVADEEKSGSEGEAVNELRRDMEMQRIERGAEDLIEGIFTGPADPQAGQRDANLGDGKQPPGIGKEVKGALGARMAAGGELTQARLAHGNEGDLGGGEEAVGNEDKQKYGEADGH